MAFFDRKFLFKNAIKLESIIILTILWPKKILILLLKSRFRPLIVDINPGSTHGVSSYACFFLSQELVDWLSADHHVPAAGSSEMVEESRFRLLRFIGQPLAPDTIAPLIRALEEVSEQQIFRERIFR
jgi:hypothetical protein